MSVINLAVRGKFGQKADLLNLIDSDKSFLLIPAYSFCNSTCPLIAANLRDAFSGLTEKSDLKVLILFFNQTDGPDQINEILNLKAAQKSFSCEAEAFFTSLLSEAYKS